MIRAMGQAAAVWVLAGAGMALPAPAHSGPLEDVATMIVTEICVPTLPDFSSAIKISLDRGLSPLDDENVVLDDETGVSLTVVPASKTLLVIDVPPLCVVTVPAKDAKPYLSTAEGIAAQIGDVTGRTGSPDTLSGDGMAWTIARAEGSVELQMLEDHSAFGDSVIFALIDFGDP